MKPTYEIIVNDFGNKIIKRTDFDNTVWWIPTDLENSDYQAYLNSEVVSPTIN